MANRTEAKNTQKGVPDGPGDPKGNQDATTPLDVVQPNREVVVPSNVDRDSHGDIVLRTGPERNPDQDTSESGVANPSLAVSAEPGKISPAEAEARNKALLARGETPKTDDVAADEDPPDVSDILPTPKRRKDE